MSADNAAYPHVWLREQRGGYGFIQRVPCRRLGTTVKGRMRIAALHPTKGEVIRFVDPAQVVEA